MVTPAPHAGQQRCRQSAESRAKFMAIAAATRYRQCSSHQRARGMDVLDLVTALVLWSSATATVAIVLLVVWWRNRAFMASLWWSGAFALMSVGRLLLALRGHVADMWAMEVAVALSLAGFALSLTGFSVLDKLKPRPWFLLPLALWALGCLTPFFAASGSFRIMLANGTAGLAYVLHVAVLRRAGRRSPARRWLSQIFWFAVGLNVASLILAALFPPADFFSYRFAAAALVAGLAALVATAIAGARLLVEETEQGLRQLIETDPLTGALNRRGLAQRFDGMAANGRRDPPLLAMLVFDLDHFKSVNDRHGHQAGDLALAHFARIAAASLREGDAFATAPDSAKASWMANGGGTGVSPGTRSTATGSCGSQPRNRTAARSPSMTLSSIPTRSSF